MCIGPVIPGLEWEVVSQRGLLYWYYGTAPKNYLHIKNHIISVLNDCACKIIWILRACQNVDHSFASPVNGVCVFCQQTKELKRLSQQELMDCSWGQLNNGCDGGEDVRAYDFIQKYGLQTEYDYGSYLAQVRPGCVCVCVCVCVVSMHLFIQWLRTWHFSEPFSRKL